MKTHLNVAFLHLDLGLGGAERLIVDAAVELAARKHTVDIYTTHFDARRCFAETLSGEFRVLVAGSWFPRNIFARFHALCACIRCVLAAISIAYRSRREKREYDVIILDQVAAVIPLLKFLLHKKVAFYCHFPDLLLATRHSLLRYIYRCPLDWLEETTTGQADLLLVNSEFTKDVFGRTFRRLQAKGCTPRVLYPAVNIPGVKALIKAQKSWQKELPQEVVKLISCGPTFLSINRFERKKGIDLAIMALGELLIIHPGCNARLVVSGGYDERVRENVEHLEELRLLVRNLAVVDAVCFLPSFTDRQRSHLLAACVAVVYTPQNEHFGIVPLEAMAAGKPVIACNSGGPLESIRNGFTGYLCEPTAHAFARAMQRVLGGSNEMGSDARNHVQNTFSRHTFGDKLNTEIMGLT